jgi:hypothetical protein
MTRVPSDTALPGAGGPGGGVGEVDGFRSTLLAGGHLLESRYSMRSEQDLAVTLVQESSHVLVSITLIIPWSSPLVGVKDSPPRTAREW